MKHYVQLWYLFAFVLLLVSSCQSSCENDSGDLSTQSLVLEARSYFEDYASTLDEVKDKLVGMHPGNIAPEWDKAKVTTQSSTVCVNVPFIAENTYEGSFFVQDDSTNSQSSKKTYYTAIYQRLIVVKDLSRNEFSCYIATMIPDKENTTRDRSKIDKMFYSGDPYTRFSGTVVYSTVGTNYTLVVEKYNNGEKDEGVSLFESTSTNYPADLKEMSAIISTSGIKRKSSAATRMEFELPEVVVTHDGGGGGSAPPNFPWPTNDPTDYPPEPPYTVPPPESGGGGGGGNNGNNNNSEGDDNDPCVSAQLLTGNKDFKQRANSIFTNLKNTKLEDGWMRNTAGELIKPKSATQNNLTYNSDDLKKTQITEDFHSHPSKKGAPTLSYDDVMSLMRMYNKGQLDVDNFTCGVITSTGCFVVVISDEEKFKNFAQIANDNKKQVDLSTDMFLYSELDPEKANTAEKWANRFMDIMNRWNSGLSFIVAPSNSSSTSLGDFKVHSESSSNCNK